MEHLKEDSACRQSIKADRKGRFYSTGRRKSAVARVWIKPGTGKFVVNGKNLKDYFFVPMLKVLAELSLKITEKLSCYDTVCVVKGGGLSGQAGALCHGISCALAGSDLSLRPLLKKEGFLTRDARRVERKKPGKPKARKSFQFSKR
ncbi:30S ribosomal protein S9 [Holospora obtusa F1]|uniref:Small ribosomal subunit protein uS9 n=1 Tax=Holospora obtusa F1 TaxID=1399147 RepID=W6TGJ1_HOLOB|nr:30S ribosomal protein S9 [Holospora obtusa]ETZ07000.1 30S ribosomal protein S9 [Holospora obtusa F1]